MYIVSGTHTNVVIVTVKICCGGIRMIVLCMDDVVGGVNPLFFPILSFEIGKLVTWVKN